MNGTVLLDKIEIREFNPATSVRNIIDRKKHLRRALEEKIQDLEKLRDRCKGKQLGIDVHFYLYSKSQETGRSKKDLDNLLKILCDVLPEHMIANSRE